MLVLSMPESSVFAAASGAAALGAAGAAAF